MSSRGDVDIFHNKLFVNKDLGTKVILGGAERSITIVVFHHWTMPLAPHDHIA